MIHSVEMRGPSKQVLIKLRPSLHTRVTGDVQVPVSSSALCSCIAHPLGRCADTFANYNAIYLPQSEIVSPIYIIMTKGISEGFGLNGFKHLWRSEDVENRSQHMDTM